MAYKIRMTYIINMILLEKIKSPYLFAPPAGILLQDCTSLNFYGKE
jgi:hypothetical protein